MTGRAPRWIWLEHVEEQVRAQTLTWQAGYVAHVLVVHYIDGRGAAWPTQQTLAAATGLSKRTVQNGLYDLEQHGLITRRHGAPAAKFGLVYELSQNGNRPF